MGALARSVREKYRVRTEAFGLREMRRIYKAEGIRIDRWQYKLRKIRAAYVITDGEPSVLLNASMKPVQPRLFALAHELKHHYVDREQASTRPFECQTDFSYDRAPTIEIGAEVFAAELIFPEAECERWVSKHLDNGSCSAEAIVRLMRACPAKISYSFLRKRLERLGRIASGEHSKVQFKKLEDKIFGVPFYRRKFRDA